MKIQKNVNICVSFILYTLSRILNVVTSVGYFKTKFDVKKNKTLMFRKLHCPHIIHNFSYKRITHVAVNEHFILPIEELRGRKETKIRD